LRQAGRSTVETDDTREGAKPGNAATGDLATGLSWLAKNRPDQAADAFAAALQEAEHLAEARYYLIRTYTLLAGENSSFLIDAARDSGRTHELEGDLAALRRDYSEAAAEYDLAASRNPDDSEIRQKLGEANVALGRMDQARSALEGAIRLNAGSGRAHYLLGQVLLSSHETAAAIAELKMAVRYAPQLVEAHALLGTAYMHAQQPALAIPELRKALPLDYYGDLHFQLYRACLATGDKVSAEKALAISKELRTKTVKADAARLEMGADEGASQAVPDK
jgi:lipopolysaccharide biosynthesis regulator YciM